MNRANRPKPDKATAMLVTATLLVSVAQGCAADGAPVATATSIVSGTPAIDVSAGSLAFRPKAIDIDTGVDAAIRLRSTDIEHDLTVDEADFHLHVDAGDTNQATLRLDTAGAYTAYCSIPGHRAAGMEMIVTVTD